MQWVKNDLNQVETEKEKRKKPKSPKRKINILEETFVQFFQRTDINAIGKIFEYENFFVKFIWLIVLLGSLSLTAWVMSWSVVAYLKYGVVSQIGVLYETHMTLFIRVRFLYYMQKKNYLSGQFFDFFFVFSKNVILTNLSTLTSNTGKIKNPENKGNSFF